MANEIKRLYTGVITTTVATLKDLTNGMVTKTIILYNAGGADAVVTLTADGCSFNINVPSLETVTFESPITCNIIKGVSNGNVNCHISGVQLGVV